MVAVIEVRTYRAHSGQRERMTGLLAERILPLHRELGMRVAGPFPSTEDDVTAVWLRAFPDRASRESMTEAFTHSPVWTGELKDLMLPLLERLDVVATEDHGGLWEALATPGSAPPPTGSAPTGAAVVVDDLGSQELRQAELDIYHRPIGVRLLHEDPGNGAEHYLIRYPAGLEADRHRHSAAHTFVVLEGAMMADGRRIGPGSYCHFPAGTVMHHAPADGEACLFVALFDGPQDVQPA